MERRTVRTHQVYGHTQASALLKNTSSQCYTGIGAHEFVNIVTFFRFFNVVTIGDKFTTKPGSWQVSFLLLGQQVLAGFWAAPSRLSFLTCAAHDLRWEVHTPVCIFLRAVMYRPAYGPPIRGFIFPATSAAQFMYFFEENAEVCSIFI